MRLGDISTVRSGLVLSRKLSREPTGHRYSQLNLRSITEDGYVDNDKIDIYEAIEVLDSEYLTQEKDIVIRLSAPYTAVLIEQSDVGMVISSNFAIIRTDESVLMPEYLAWLLNTSKVKRQIFENTSSNMLGAIKPKFFADFDIESVSLNDQHIIAGLNRLARQESRLLIRLSKEKEKYYASVIDQAQRKMRREHNNDNKK